MDDHFGPKLHTKVKHRSGFCTFDAFMDLGGRQGRDRAPLAVPTDAPDRGACSSRLIARRAVLALDLFACASLAEHAVKSAVAQNELSADLARVYCVLSGCGTCRQGYRSERERKGRTAKGRLRD